jgi:hypothetical protein
MSVVIKPSHDFEINLCEPFQEGDSAEGKALSQCSGTLAFGGR